MPFSEKKSDLTGLFVGKVAASAPVFTSKILMVPSAPPAARRWPSGWNLTQLRTVDNQLVRGVFRIVKKSREY